MEQAQSYYSTIIKADLGTYQMRMLLKVVQRTRLLTSGRNGFQSFLDRDFIDRHFNCRFVMPVSEIVGGKTHNYTVFKEKMRRLKESGRLSIEYYDARNKVWHLADMFEDIELREGDGLLSFRVPSWFVGYLCDFSVGGYRSYSFENAMSLSNPNAARLYLLTCSMTKPLVYRDVDLFREMLGVGGKYKRATEFARCCLAPAARELEKRGFNGFSYELIREVKGKPHSPVVGVRLKPVKREHKEANVGEQIAAIKQDVPQVMYDYLVLQCGFSLNEMRGNKKTFAAFAAMAGARDKFTEIISRARRGRKNHGYIISAMKRVIAGGK